MNVYLAAAGVQNRHDLDLFLFARSQTTKNPFLSGFFLEFAIFITIFTSRECPSENNSAEISSVV